MGQLCSRNDFEWVYDEEPHATRRKQILAKHPEVKSLMQHDPRLKWWVVLLVSLQFLSLPLLRHCSWQVLLLTGYFFTGVINHSLSLAIHEISHNIAFGSARPMANRLLGMFANLPMGFPMSISFKKYHLLHHRYQGDPSLDTDLPTHFEGYFFHRRWTKFIWLLLQPFFYVMRPLFVLPLPMSKLEISSVIVQLTADLLLVWYFNSLWPILYLVGSLLLCMGVHPVAGHFISEHYMFRKGYETYSYYGILNAITFNVGYHNEHHDFPSIPGSRLPMLKKMAPEFYDNLPCHHSWTRVLYDFVMDPEISVFNRVKRRKPQQTQVNSGENDNEIEASTVHANAETGEADVSFKKAN